MEMPDSRPALSEAHFVAPDETAIQATDVVRRIPSRAICGSTPGTTCVDVRCSGFSDSSSFWSSSSVLFPTLFTQVDPRSCSLSISNDGPSAGHPLGFTLQGCDIFARIVYGTSTSLTVGLIATVIITVIGLIMGALAGYYGGWLDSILSRIGDIFFAIPYILAAVVVMSVFRHSATCSIIALAIGGFAWASHSAHRASRGALGQEADFVMASRGARCVSKFKSS